MSPARVFVIWLLLAALAVANGTLRVKVWTPRVGDPAGHVMASLLFVAVIAIVSAMSARWMVPGLEAAPLWGVGAAWLAMTVFFEFGFGHWVMGHPWSKLLADYDLPRGRIWTLVLLATFVLPVVMGRLRARG